MERAANRNPLFQIMLTHYVGTPGQGLDLPKVSVTPGDQTLNAVKTDLDLYLEDDSRELRGFLTYATDLLDEPGALRFVETLTAAFDALATRTSPLAADLTVSDLNLLSDADQECLSAWSKSGRRPAPHRPQHLATHPGHRPLRRHRADRLHHRRTPELRRPRGPRHARAQLLLSQGVQVGDRVAILLPRSIEQIITVVAALRVGAAYVPLDPAYPQQRITTTLQDAQPALLITNTELAETAASLPNQPLLLLDAGEVAGADAGAGSGAGAGSTGAVSGTDPDTSADSGLPVLARPITGQDIAYLIYTSGTTGRPKGVAVNHEA